LALEKPGLIIGLTVSFKVAEIARAAQQGWFFRALSHWRSRGLAFMLPVRGLIAFVLSHSARTLGIMDSGKRRLRSGRDRLDDL